MFITVPNSCTLELLSQRSLCMPENSLDKLFNTLYFLFKYLSTSGGEELLGDLADGTHAMYQLNAYPFRIGWILNYYKHKLLVKHLLIILFDEKENVIVIKHLLKVRYLHQVTPHDRTRTSRMQTTSFLRIRAPHNLKTRNSLEARNAPQMHIVYKRQNL